MEKKQVQSVPLKPAPDSALGEDPSGIRGRNNDSPYRSQWSAPESSSRTDADPATHRSAIAAEPFQPDCGKMNEESLLNFRKFTPNIQGKRSVGKSC
jgi:hypothetical protein